MPNKGPDVARAVDFLTGVLDRIDSGPPRRPGRTGAGRRYSGSMIRSCRSLAVVACVAGSLAGCREARTAPPTDFCEFPKYNQSPYAYSTSPAPPERGRISVL